MSGLLHYNIHGTSIGVGKVIMIHRTIYFLYAAVTPEISCKSGHVTILWAATDLSTLKV